MFCVQLEVKKSSKAPEPVPDSEEDEDESDGENGMNFMAKVRAMEAAESGVLSHDSEIEENKEVGKPVSLTLGADGLPASALSDVEKKRQTKRRIRAKNFKLAKSKNLKKAKRKLGLK